MSIISKSAEQAGAKAPATGCRKCGSTTFIVLESTAYDGDVSRDSHGASVLHCYDGDGGIDGITCRQCGEEYQSDDFDEIIFD